MSVLQLLLLRMLVATSAERTAVTRGVSLAIITVALPPRVARPVPLPSRRVHARERRRLVCSVCVCVFRVRVRARPNALSIVQMHNRSCACTWDCVLNKWPLFLFITRDGVELILTQESVSFKDSSSFGKSR